MSCVIGKTVDGNQDVTLDIERLAYTRMFIQATSGGGKTNAVRVILERTHGKVQHIVYDWEGEYSNMREKYDYILAGKDGDIPADPRSAEILARRILELGTSIIVDLYVLPIPKRLEYVKLFSRALVNSPKALYSHPVLIVIDEIQHYIPESERKGESEVAESVIDLLTQGRKRGLGVLAVSQRISKVKKDGVSECLNKAIGLCGLDIDRKRAGEELGFTTKDQILSLRDLDQGVFYIFGPALSKHVVLAKFPRAETDPPPLGHGVVKVPPPSDQVLKQLAKLTDLPKEAERELKTKEEMMNSIRELKRDLRIARSEAPKPKVDEKALDRQAKLSYQRGWKEAERQYAEVVQKLKGALSQTTTRLSRISEIVGGTKPQLPDFTVKLKPPAKFFDIPIKVDPTLPDGRIELRTPQKTVIVQEGDVKFGNCEKMILKFLSMDSNVDRGFDKQQIGAVTNYSATSGAFGASLSLLKKQGLITQQGDNFRINPNEVERAREISAGVRMATLQDWLGALPAQDQKLYQILYEHSDETFSKEKLAEDTGYSATSGSFGAAISHLCTLGLAEKNGEGVRFNQNITEFL